MARGQAPPRRRLQMQRHRLSSGHPRRLVPWREITFAKPTRAAEERAGRAAMSKDGGVQDHPPARACALSSVSVPRQPAACPGLRGRSSGAGSPLRESRTGGREQRRGARRMPWRVPRPGAPGSGPLTPTRHVCGLPRPWASCKTRARLQLCCWLGCSSCAAQQDPPRVLFVAHALARILMASARVP